jgi:hypothetical protein
LPDACDKATSVPNQEGGQSDEFQSGAGRKSLLRVNVVQNTIDNQTWSEL